jgi:hypothetical protein
LTYFIIEAAVRSGNRASAVAAVGAIVDCYLRDPAGYGGLGFWAGLMCAYSDEAGPALAAVPGARKFVDRLAADGRLSGEMPDRLRRITG